MSDAVLPEGDPAKPGDQRRGGNTQCPSECQRLASVLRESERRFKTLLYNLPERVFHKDRDSVYVSCNRNYAVELGLEPEQMVGKTDFDFFPREIAEKYRRDDSRIMAEGGTAEIEESYYTREGQERLIRTVKTALKDEQGHVTGILGIFSDITARKRAEAILLDARDELERNVAEHAAELAEANCHLRREIEERTRVEAALRQSEERYELAARGAGAGIWDWDLVAGTVYYSPRWKALSGYDEHEIGDSLDEWASRLHPEDREWIFQFQEDFLAGTDLTTTVEYRLRHRDGSYRWIIAHALVVRDAQGKAVRMVGSHGDITDRKRAEEARGRTEARYRALVESSPDAVVMTDLQGRVAFASQRAAEQHGFQDPDQLTGRLATDFVAQSDRARFRASIDSLITEGIHRNIEYTLLRRDGTEFGAELSSAIVRDAAGNPEALMAVYRDVTERKQTAERLRANDTELLAAAEIQAHLLPQESPQVPGFDIAGHCYPAEAAAGDSFDYRWLPDQSLLIVLGDVSGHGLGPAIVAADFCARLRTLSDDVCNLPQMAARLNAGLYGETAGEIFVTAILGRLNPQTRILTCLNAGHPKAVVLDAAGRVRTRLADGSLPFAVMPATEYTADEAVELAAGDLVLFYTDGLVEAHPRGAEEFGIQRAIQVIRANQNRSAAEIVEALYQSACEYAGLEKPKDDITVVIVRVLQGDTYPVAAPQGSASWTAIAAGPAESSNEQNAPGDDCLQVEQGDGFTILRIADTEDFDTNRYAHLQHALMSFVQHQQPPRLLVDLSAIAYCSTALINSLLMAQNRMKSWNGTLVLCGARHVVLETLEHLGLIGTLFSLYPDEHSARNALAEPQNERE
jgi:PAS domain S-box-containing protein